MAKVVGVGGVFFKSSHPRRLAKWYSKWLGITVEMKAAASFRPRDMPEASFMVWSVFPSTTRYFGPSTKPFMINLVVDDLDGALQQVRRGGGQIIGHVEEYPYGRFGWFLDPDRNKVELWEPPVRRGRRGKAKKGELPNRRMQLDKSRCFLNLHAPSGLR